MEAGFAMRRLSQLPLALAKGSESARISALAQYLAKAINHLRNLILHLKVEAIEKKQKLLDHLKLYKLRRDLVLCLGELVRDNDLKDIIAGQHFAAEADGPRHY